MPTEMSILVSSIRIVLMDLEYMFIQMDKSMKDFGRVICKMVLVKKNWKMEVSMMACSNKVKKMVKELTNGLIIANILVIGKTIILKERANILGQI
jgi:predicted sugar kinase